MPRENRIISEIIIAKSIDSSYSFKQYNPTMILAKYCSLVERNFSRCFVDNPDISRYTIAIKDEIISVSFETSFHR